MSSRFCSRSSCQELAVATLTYVYATSTAVVGPLAQPAQPHSYDLCVAHARNLTAPRGWELVRHDGEFPPPPSVPDDLVALAEAVRETRDPLPGDDGLPGPGDDRTPRGRRGHLRVVPPTR